MEKQSQTPLICTHTYPINLILILISHPLFSLLSKVSVYLINDQLCYINHTTLFNMLVLQLFNRFMIFLKGFRLCDVVWDVGVDQLLNQE